MQLVRRVGFFLIAVAAVVVAVAMGPDSREPVDAGRFDRLIDQALADYEENDARTQGAPQQQVVNGWIARDLLTVMSQQNNAILEQAAPAASDDRVPLLLMLVVLAVSWHGLTQRSAADSAIVPLASGPSVLGEPSAGAAGAGSSDSAGVSVDEGNAGRTEST